MQDKQISPNYYEILGVDRNATIQQIKNARNRLAMEYHPDRIPTHLKELNEIAKEKITLINQAFGTLSDPRKRQIYNQTLDSKNHEPDTGQRSNQTTSQTDENSKKSWQSKSEQEFFEDLINAQNQDAKTRNETKNFYKKSAIQSFFESAFLLTSIGAIAYAWNIFDFEKAKVFYPLWPYLISVPAHGVGILFLVGASEKKGEPTEPETLFSRSWLSLSGIVMTAVLVLIQKVNTYSFVWWILVILGLASVPGLLVGWITALIVGVIIGVAYLIIKLFIVLIKYFINHPW